MRSIINTLCLLTFRPAEQQYFRLDTSGLQQGENVLTVTIRDLVSGAETSRDRTFWIDD